MLDVLRWEYRAHSHDPVDAAATGPDSPGSHLACFGMTFGMKFLV